jgi:hypothetical protein
VYRSLIAAVCFFSAGCSLRTYDSFPSAGAGHPPLPEPVLSLLRQHVAPELEWYVGDEQRSVLKALATAKTFPARGKQPWAIETLTDPWSGLTMLEQQGLQVARAAGSARVDLADVIGALEAGRSAAARDLSSRSSPLPPAKNAEAAIDDLVSVLTKAEELREKALERLTPADRQALFDHAASFVDNFIPQITVLPQEIAGIEADRHFAELSTGQLDYDSLVKAAQTLAPLADDDWLDRIAEIVQADMGLPKPAIPRGVTGEVLYVRETPYGLIVIGGPGPNTYELDERFAIVIDVGGDDVYRGTIASGADVMHGISVVIDLAGNDTYHAAPFGLATGRLGVGLLIDRAGNDVYHLAEGSGGVGIDGIGILYDHGGDDQYIGNKFTQGAAAFGLGILLDGAGNDSHTSYGYALGFGGPMGIGALIEVNGDDRYQCGGKYPSNYNAIEEPDAKPGDPKFQYEGFCMGTGSGKRIFTDDPAQLPYANARGLAGGLGLLIDLKGNDHYQSANFSQGAGYFFGAGIKLDMEGNDEHGAARYGHGAAAHYGVGLFIDYGGDDLYTSTGPFYNGGTAWDLSVAVCVDAGQGNDVYDFHRTDGLGRADYHSWSLFIEDGGKDRYRLGAGAISPGMGMAFNDSLSGFFDLGGQDEYLLSPNPDSTVSLNNLGRGNGLIVLRREGSLFIDR